MHYLLVLIGKNDLPFRCVEWPEFKNLVTYLRSDAKLPNRYMVFKELEKLYLEKKSEIVDSLANNTSKISITIDAWTSSNQLPFLGIKCHWIDSEWELKRQLLHFQVIEGEHS